MGRLIRVVPAAERRDRSGPVLAPVVDGVAVVTSVPLRPAAHPRVWAELAAVGCQTAVPEAAPRPPGWCWIGFHDGGGTCALL
jgi:hypothetical protein